MLYVDSSALVKLVVEEPESGALERALEGARYLVTSSVAAVEVPRAVLAAGHGAEARRRAELLLLDLGLVVLDERLVRLAIDLAPPSLRTLDAIHLASALTLGSELEALVTYDRRLADAAGAAGITVTAPR